MVDGSGGELSLYPKERPWNFCADQHDQHDQLTKNIRIALPGSMTSCGHMWTHCGNLSGDISCWDVNYLLPG